MTLSEMCQCLFLKLGDFEYFAVVKDAEGSPKRNIVVDSACWVGLKTVRLSLSDFGGDIWSVGIITCADSTHVIVRSSVDCV